MEKSKAFNKQNIAFLIVAIINFAVCLFLTLTCIPGQIPMHVDFNERIVDFCSKWVLSINIALPLVLSVLVLVFHKKDYLTFFLKALFVLLIYENLLAYSYYSLAQDLSAGMLCEIPIAASIFMPFSVFLTVTAIKIKNIPYKSKFIGIRTKYTKADEFIWKHTHFFARDVFFATGVILFFVNVPFLFIRLAYIPTAILLIAITTAIIIINHQSKLMYKKLVDMQARKDRMNAKDKPEQTPENNETKKEEKYEQKSKNIK